MCAIVDASVAGEVFGGASPAGREFFNWLNSGPGRLVVGGKLLEELEGSEDFCTWARAATLAGRVTTLNKDQVEERTRKIEDVGVRSNDPHVLAIAQISHARLLFTNDRPLEEDFKNKTLIDKPRGRVYHTRNINPSDNKQFGKTHRRLLNTTVCRP